MGDTKKKGGEEEGVFFWVCYEIIKKYSIKIEIIRIIF
jgi:hypothetical protein